MVKTIKHIKQLTLDTLPTAPIDQDNKKTIQKQILITKMETITKIDEITLRINFKLEPSWKMFSKIKTELFFENTHINSALISVLQGPLGTNTLEYSWVIDMKGIARGAYHLKVEMYEIWSSGEKSNQTTQEITLDYIPQTRQARLIKIPFIKNITGTELEIISDQEKQLYLDIEKTRKKEQTSRQNE
jgi:hypothetical protein